MNNVIKYSFGGNYNHLFHVLMYYVELCTYLRTYMEKIVY